MFKKKWIGLALLLCLGLSNPSTAQAQTYDVPSNNAFKAYMSYTAIKSQSSMQYKLQLQCTTSTEGFRMYGDRYVIAIGTYYTETVGTLIDVYLENGTMIPCIVGDIKANKDTDTTNRQVPTNGNVIEFIVDTNVMSEDILRSGNISNVSGFEGEIAYLEVLNDSAQTSNQAVNNLPIYIVNGKHSVNMAEQLIYIISYVDGSETKTVPVSEQIYSEITIGVSSLQYDANTGKILILTEGVDLHD